MYQLGLGAATAEVPSMSVALGANRWASRVVVVLQLAAWSAVGIVLLQKGVSSLQKTSAEARNATKSNYTETVANLIMKKIPGDGVGDFSSDFQDFRILPEDDKKTSRMFSNIKNEDEITSKTVPAVIPITSLTTNHLWDNKKTRWNTDKNQFQDHPNQLDREEFPQNTPNNIEHTAASTSSVYPTTTTAKYEKPLETRKKMRNSNINGGSAAAAAVAMVAVGAVMLVLGPIVIILRALDERRQERRFLKLSGQDDLPPSYEQATLMDEAPRYSTLNLNTMTCSPAIADTSSSQVHDSAEDEGTIREV